MLNGNTTTDLIPLHAVTASPADLARAVRRLRHWWRRTATMGVHMARYVGCDGQYTSHAGETVLVLRFLDRDGREFTGTECVA